MNFRGIFIALIVFFLSICNSFSAMMTFSQKTNVNDTPTSTNIASGIEFNSDGTKMFVSYAKSATSPATDRVAKVRTYNLTSPYDISTAEFAGTSKNCELIGVDITGNRELYDLEISNDGMKLLVASRHFGSDTADEQKAHVFNLSSPYDISSCVLASQTTDLNNDANTHGSNAGDYASLRRNHKLQSLEISNDGMKLFLLFFDDASDDVGGRLYEYELSSAYDLSSLTLVQSAGIKFNATLTTGIDNPSGMRFSPNGKRLFITSHAHGGTPRVTQVSLSRAFDTSSFVIDGNVQISNNSMSKDEKNSQPRGVAFNGFGLKLYVSGDKNHNTDEVYEYDLVCPFNIIEGKCPPISENAVRLGIAEAQVELANRSIYMSTNSALNRLKWIRRNKDKQNLSNQNIKLNFSNRMLSSLSNLPISEFKKISNNNNIKDTKKNYFHWSEGSVSFGTVGDSSLASAKKFKTNSLTFGVDKFTDEKNIYGVALRFGFEDVNIGKTGSNSDTNTFTDGSNLKGKTYNATYYSTSPIKNDKKYVDKILGVGRIKFDIVTHLDGKRLEASRTGEQIYGSIKVKDEYLNDNTTFVPYGQFDLGLTHLDNYKERGRGGINVEDQFIRTANLRTGLSFVGNTKDENDTTKAHGKLEYKAELINSTNFQYSYVDDSTSSFIEKLETGALHNLSGEIGFDIILQDNYSIFVIYERNIALGTGHTDNIYIALGYLPYKNSEYKLSLNGSETLVSNLEIKKNINGFDVGVQISDELTNLGNNREAFINLNKVF